MPDLPVPGSEHPEGTLLVFPSDGREVYRLLRRGSEEPDSGDFQPRYGKKASKAAGQSELLRLGISHFLTLDDAQAVNTQNSRIAKVTLSEGLFNFARTGQLNGHIDVWGDKDDFVQLAQPVA